MVIKHSIGTIQLDTFSNYFSSFNEQYVLIGGTATMLLLSEVGFSSRTTKDLDIVLCIETLTPEFINHFWGFIKSGGYKCTSKLNGSKCLYRFEEPENPIYPYMLELLTDESVQFEGINQVTHPITLDDEIVSLSAIMLNKDYYQFLMLNRTEINGIVLVNEIGIIPLKVCAFLDLVDKKSAGNKISSDIINKHKNDVYRLVQLLTDFPLPNIPQVIKNDIIRFCSEVKDDSNILSQISVVIKEIDEIKQILLNVYV